MPIPKPETLKDLMDSIRRIVHALRSSHRAAGNVNLTGAQLFVLSSLGTAEGPLGVKDLADRTRTDQSTVSVVVGRLVDRGIVKRRRSTIDTRRVELSLTARGQAIQKKAPATVAQNRLADALGQLSTSDAATLSRILKRIVDLMGEAAAPALMLFGETTDAAPTPARRTPGKQQPAVKKARRHTVKK